MSSTSPSPYMLTNERLMLVYKKRGNGNTQLNQLPGQDIKKKDESNSRIPLL